MQDDWLKRAIHFVCGAFVGACLGVLVVGMWWRTGGRQFGSDSMMEALVWGPIAGAVLIGLLSACFLDRFWAAIQDRGWPGTGGGPW